MLSNTPIGLTFRRTIENQPKSARAFLHCLKGTSGRGQVDIYEPVEFDGFSLASFAKLAKVYAVNGEGQQEAFEEFSRTAQRRLDSQMELFATLKNECEDIKNNCIAVENRLKASLEEFSKQTKAAEVSHTAMLASNEAAFRNHVMLEGPAQYWERIEERYRRAAGFHTAKAVAVVSIGLIFITVLLAAPLEGLKGTSFSATSVRSIVLLTFGSVRNLTIPITFLI